MQQLMFKSCHLIITLKLKIDKKNPFFSDTDGPAE